MSPSPSTINHSWLLDSLEQVKVSILNHVPPDARWLAEAVQHSLGNSGKLLRPRITLLMGQLLGCDKQNALVEAAAVAEMIHVATLLHDDVLDVAELRRGQLTARHIWGNEVSILTGDYLLAQASRKLAQIGNIRLVAIFSDVLADLCDGEVEQIRTRYQLDLSWEAYLKKNLCKTASLFVAGCESAGVLKEVDAAEISRLRQFGETFGVGFQLVDDLLDYTATSVDLGKPVMSDLRNGILTAPILLVPADTSEKAHVRKLITDLFAQVNTQHPPADEAGNDDVLSIEPQLITIKQLLLDCGALQSAQAMAAQYINEAKSLLAVYPLETSQPLLTLCDKVLEQLPTF